VLALHGADDPFVPPEEVRRSRTRLRKAKVDWQLVAVRQRGAQLHDPDAKVPGKNEYNPKVARRPLS